MATAAPLSQIRRLRVCLLGGDSFQPGVGKADVAASLLRGLTADRPGLSDPVLDLAFDYGVFERAWRTLLDPGPPVVASVSADTEDTAGLAGGTATAVDQWGIGALSAWDSEGRVRFDRRTPGESTPPYDADPAEDFAALCAGNPEKLSLGHKRSYGIMKSFRDALGGAIQDLTVFEDVHKDLTKLAEATPRELVRKDRPCPGVLATFARFSPEVGEFHGCGVVFVTVFEPSCHPHGSDRNMAMLYAAAPNSRVHRNLTPGTLLCALRSIGSNITRTVREYNRVAGTQAAPESWERTMWWEVDLRALVEYYLSDRNLRNDRSFRDKILADEEGWVDMELLPGCQGEGKQAELLGALSSSKCVETKVSDDGKVFVRRGGGRAVPQLLEEVRNRGMKRNFWGSQGGSQGGEKGGFGGGNRDDMTCWDFKNKGACPRGASCRYKHGDGQAAAPAADGAEVPADGSGLKFPRMDDEAGKAAASTTAEAGEEAPDWGEEAAPDASQPAADATVVLPGLAPLPVGAVGKREAPAGEDLKEEGEKWRKRSARFGLPGQAEAGDKATTAATPAPADA